MTVAGAALLQRVAGAVTRVGGNVLSSQVDVQGTQSKEGYVSLVASCQVDLAALQQLLYDLEAGMPFLFIDQLVAQAPLPTTETGTGRMRVTLAVSGQWEGGKWQAPSVRACGGSDAAHRLGGFRCGAGGPGYAAGWLGGRRTHHDSRTQKRAGCGETAANARGNPLWAIPLSTLTATRERPIFLPTRRPPSPVIANTPIEPTRPVAAPPPEQPPRFALVGAVTGDNN